MSDSDDLLARIDALFPAPEEESVAETLERRAQVRDALANRFGDALRDLGLEGLVPVVTFVVDGPVVIFPALSRKEFDRVLLRLEDLARHQEAVQQGSQSTSLFS